MTHKIECYNCKRLTEVSPPKYRCTHCNYPLQRLVEGEVPPPDAKTIGQIQQNVAEIKQKIQQDLKPATPPDIAITIKDMSGGGNAPKEASPATKKEEQPPLSAPPKTIPIEEKKNELPKTIPPPPVAAPAKTREQLLKTLETLLSQKKPDVEKATLQKLEKIEVVSSHRPENSDKPIAGWLVVHTENKIPITYELYEGNNIIGRADTNHKTDIPVRDDKYVSRTHCRIEVKKDFLHRFLYVLSDDDSGDTKASTNGTFVNGLSERLPAHTVIYLRDGDIIQVGETKLAFKDTYQSDNFADAATSVVVTNYTKTIPVK